MFAAAAAGAQPLRISNLTVVDVKSGALLRHRDVDIRDERIASVLPASSKPLPNERIVDGRGKFLIPGLWDCHIHLSWTTESALPLLVALGVTDVRDVGSSFSQIEGWRARIAAGDQVSPRIMRVGPILNGKEFALIILAAAGAGAGQSRPSCHIGDYISVCDFTPAASSVYRIVSRAEGIAIGSGPHVLTTEYRINGASCKGSSRWTTGMGSVSAGCLARLRAGTMYHIVAVTDAKGANHRGNLELTIRATTEAPNLVVP